MLPNQVKALKQFKTLPHKAVVGRYKDCRSLYRLAIPPSTWNDSCNFAGEVLMKKKKKIVEVEVEVVEIVDVV